MKPTLKPFPEGTVLMAQMHYSATLGKQADGGLLHSVMALLSVGLCMTIPTMFRRLSTQRKVVYLYVVSGIIN
jgi:cyanate permease